MCTDEIKIKLFELRDQEYSAFQKKLLPTVEPERIIGVRTPELRKLAKQIVKSADASSFLKALPHLYFDENQLHAFILSEIKDYDACIGEVNRFLPFIDNWATCDQLSPKAFAKHKPDLLEQVEQWLVSGKTYAVRFGIGMLMQHFLNEDFNAAYPELVAGIRSEEYYVRMMIAWYFATALVKQYDAVLPFLLSRRLNPWTHNKTIQKAVESYRLSSEQKAYLKTLKIVNHT